MKYSNDLYQLIQSLNQSEKRYVKLLAKAFTSKGTQNQLDLFDAFDRQQNSYKEDKIRKEFASRISAKNFHVAKNRLYNLILRALYLYHAKNSKRERINQFIFQADILRKKGLFKQCDLLLEKAYTLALEEEYFPHAVHTLERKAASCLDQRDVQKIKDYLDTELKEELDLIDTYRNSLVYQYLELKTLFITHKNQIARSEEQMAEIHKIKEHPLLQDESTARSRLSRNTFWFINGFIHRYEGNYEQACVYWGRFVEQFEEMKEIPKERMMEYIADLNNLMFLQAEASQYKLAEQTCQKMKALFEHKQVKSDDYLTLKVQERVMEFELEYYIWTHQYAKGLAYVETNKEEIENLYGRVGHFRQLVLDYAIACLYICNEDHESANSWLEKVFGNKLLKEHEYIYAGAMVLNLITHFELGNFQFLESLLLNTYRMMYKRKLLYKSEKIIFKYLRKYLKIRSNKEIIESLRELKRELIEAQKDRSEKFFLDKLDLTVWIESKIQNKKMAEVVKRSK